jgi:hypothetical protein
MGILVVAKSAGFKEPVFTSGALLYVLYNGRFLNGKRPELLLHGLNLLPSCDTVPLIYYAT